MRTLCSLLLLAGLVPLLSGQETVYWLSDYKEALAEARRTGKPIFLEYRCEP